MRKTSLLLLVLMMLMATISDAACYDPSQFGGRTNGFVFTTTGYAVFDTIFNTWEGAVDIVLRRE